MGATSPSGVSRPFDARRDGFVMGEGAGALVLEPEEAAKERAAEVLGYLTGYGATADAHHLTAPEASGDGAARAIEMRSPTPAWVRTRGPACSSPDPGSSRRSWARTSPRKSSAARACTRPTGSASSSPRTTPPSRELLGYMPQRTAELANGSAPKAQLEGAEPASGDARGQAPAAYRRHNHTRACALLGDEDRAPEPDDYLPKLLGYALKARWGKRSLTRQQARADASDEAAELAL